MIQSNSEKPIIITGTPHSGTTLLSRIIGGHPDVYFISELKSIRKDGTKKHAPEDSSGVNDCLLWWDNFSYPFWDDTGKPLVREPIFNEQGMNRVRETYLNKAAGKRLVLKNPEFINRAHLVHKLFPDALVVVSMRHPWCGLQSMAKEGNEKFMLMSQKHFGMADNLLLKAACSWKDSIDTYNRKKDKNWIMVKYEDIVFDTNQTLADLFKFLNMDEFGYIEKASKIPKNLNHSYYWVKKQLEKSEYKDEILSFVAEGAEQFDYSLSFDGLNIKRPSFIGQVRAWSQCVHGILNKAKRFTKQCIKKIICWRYSLFNSQDILLGNTAFLAHIPEGDVLLVDGEIIKNAFDSVRDTNKNPSLNISLDIIERDFFRLRSKKYVVLLDKSNACKPSVIMKNISMYPKDPAAQKKIYEMKTSVAYINKETYVM